MKEIKDPINDVCIGCPIPTVMAYKMLVKKGRYECDGPEDGVDLVASEDDALDQVPQVVRRCGAVAIKE